MRWPMTSSACAWPMTRLPRCASSVRTVAISSFTILPTGMPVQAEITSPTIWASTHTRISGVSPCSASSSALSRPRSARNAFGSIVASTAAAVSAGGATLCPHRVGFEFVADFADPDHQVSLFFPLRFERGELVLDLRVLLGATCSSFSTMVASRGSFPIQHAGLNSQIIELARGIFDGRRELQFCPRAQTRAGRVEDADGLVGQLAAGDIAVGEAARRQPRLRRGCELCDAFRGLRTMPRSIIMHCSSSGSSTFTTWKRRASAASFSKYFLYSDHVVAAMVRSSPRARAGFRRLAASFWPAWPPAPIMVCASSMKRMMGFGDDFTSSISPLRRFSNSPLTPAPA